MLVIRLFRVGKINQPAFKIIVTDKRRSSTGGRFVEEVGFYNPLTKEKVLKPERIKYWLSVGAKPSPTIFNLLVSEKIIEGKKIDVHKKPKVKKETASASAEATASQEEKPKEEKPALEKKPAEEKPKEEKPKEEKPEKKEEPKTETPPKETPAVEEKK